MGRLINLRHLDIRGTCISWNIPPTEKQVADSPTFLFNKVCRGCICRDCDSLPALGQLPSLKHLSVSGMHRILQLTQEFYGSDLPKSLPFLATLRISGCPKLGDGQVAMFGIHLSLIHQNFMSLQKLRISDMTNLVELPSELCGLTNLGELRISNCASLEIIRIQDGIDTLEVERCGNLEALTTAKGIHLKFLQSMKISGCENLTSFPQKLAAPSLKYLWVYNCQKLKALPDFMHELLPSLRNLWISNCPELESFPDGGLPFNKDILDISTCENLIKGREEWGLQRLPYLRCFRIYGSDETSILDETWKLPSTIQIITIECLPHLKTLSVKALEGFKSLEVLEIKHRPQLQSLPAEGLQGLTSLATLEIEDCGQLKSLPEVGLPSSLSVLKISSFPQFQSLPENGLPTSLCRVEINDCALLTSRLQNKKDED
ncbi:hypothetical protein RND71_035387 [Anisodus tanguticus]|uniref:Uncharacterized protein n=1 Tax=Anisodus tanguticus TaxID=243964 RepID=A0AAE1R4T4_9SOLA|nr:hypothetical protein RND71_035387 [Anisodus tanguticus]